MIYLQVTNDFGDDDELKVGYIVVDLPDYCDAWGNTTNQLHIVNFSLNTIDNDSGEAQYSDFTHITTDILIGQDYSFSAEASGGVAFLKAILAPYANIKVMPTGGINEANFLSYLTIPQVFACGGSWFVSKALMSAGDQEEIRAMIRRIIAGLGQ